jgi:putative pyruvate formate lyase activating enzyme
MTALPSYLSAVTNGRLEATIAAIRARLSSCTLCPRACRVNRLEGQKGYCGAPEDLVISSVFPHFGEEAPLVGTGGSGTVFLAGCGLKCVFCQNYEISMFMDGAVYTPAQAASGMVGLQERGCHNINFVTPTHYLPQILEAVLIAARMGLNVPLVYNCGGYESLDVIEALDGIVDIYMPDFKFMDEEPARKYCGAPDYPEVAGAAIREMQRQVGDLVINDAGIAEQGLLIRHLVMPNMLDYTKRVLDFIRQEISEDAFVNVMAQYHPCHRASEYEELGRRVSGAEYADAVSYARAIGLRRAGRH